MQFEAARKPLAKMRGMARSLSVLIFLFNRLPIGLKELPAVFGEQ